MSVTPLTAPMHGANVLIYIEDTLVAGQKNCTINVKRDTIEVQSKSDYPNKKFMSNWAEWDCSFDGVFLSPEYAEALLSGSEVDVEIEFGSHTSPSITYSGTANVTEANIEASQDDVATLSCTLQGTGALTIS